MDTDASGIIGIESKVSEVAWSRPWNDTVWFLHPFTGEPIPVSKKVIPFWTEPEPPENQK